MISSSRLFVVLVGRLRGFRQLFPFAGICSAAHDTASCAQNTLLNRSLDPSDLLPPLPQPPPATLPATFEVELLPSALNPAGAFGLADFNFLAGFSTRGTAVWA